MRAADVLVSMHGGDVVNGLHLLPCRSVIEVVNCGFQLAHWEWLEQNARLLTPVIAFERIVLPPRNFSLAEPTVSAEAIPACDVHGELGDWKGEAKRRRHRKYMTAWNQASALPWALLEQVRRVHAPSWTPASCDRWRP